METKRRYLIDTRTAKEIREEIAQTARFYTPEWKFDTSNPDAGSVIGMIFAGQMEENIQKINLLPEKYRVEFVNLFGVSLQPAKPARAVVVIEAGGYAGAGVRIARGTALLGESDQGQEIIFETTHDICVTNAKLTHVLGISGEYSKVIKYQDEDGNVQFPIPLFQYEQEGTVRETLLIYHSYLYDTDTEEIRIRFTGNKASQELAALFTKKDWFCFSYQSENGISAFEDAAIVDDFIILRPGKRMAAVLEQGREQFLIQLDMLQQVRDTIELLTIELLTAERKSVVQFVSNGVSQMDAAEFYAFGEQIAIYNECYIGEDVAFSKQGAEVTLCFELEFKVNTLALFAEEKTDSYPIVKRKPRQGSQPGSVICHVQEVVIEYYNGIGWKQLACIQNADRLFEKADNSGTQLISFIVPEHWEPVQVGGYEVRCLRMMVTRADHCYIRPGIHYSPLIKDLNITYRYTQAYLQPECVKRIAGTEVIDMTKHLLEKQPFTAFSIFPYTGNYMYFGFDRKFEGGPVSLFFSLKEEGNAAEGTLVYEYASPSGFRTLQVIDDTRGLSSKGTILFWPPENMAKVVVEGRNSYWIRILKSGSSEEQRKSCPLLEALQMNAVSVQNIEQQDTQEYTIEAVEPNMSFPLYGVNILDADVWINEKEQIPEEQIRQMMKDIPERVEAALNIHGEIEEFYVLWTETENFEFSQGTDRHYIIDRLHNRIRFGDGISVRIPRNIHGIAFKVSLRCCSGDMGNVGAGNIHDFRSHIFPVESVGNPMPSYGGSLPEDIEHSLQRGSNLLSSGNRLVTQLDYSREVKAFSDHIDKVSCMSAYKPVGQADDEGLEIVLLMKEYRQGSYSFQVVKESLKQHLSLRCEMTCMAGLRIIEPIFVHIFVEVWLLVSDITETFSTQHTWQEQIEAYLEPASRDSHKGWEIGVLPTEQQIYMMLRGIEQRCYVKARSSARGELSERHTIFMERYAVRAVYRDVNGIYDMVLSEIPKSPIMIGCNGEHRIHTNVKKGEANAKQ